MYLAAENGNNLATVMILEKAHIIRNNIDLCAYVATAAEQGNDKAFDIFLALLRENQNIIANMSEQLLFNAAKGGNIYIINKILELMPTESRKIICQKNLPRNLPNLNSLVPAGFIIRKSVLHHAWGSGKKEAVIAILKYIDDKTKAWENLRLCHVGKSSTISQEDREAISNYVSNETSNLTLRPF